MMRGPAAILCAAIVLAATPAWSACLRAGQEQSAAGWLKSEDFKDANGQRESAYILRIDDATCLEGKETFDKVDHARTIQIYSTKNDVNKRIRKLVRKSVRVRGKPFGAHTAHHHAPIVMEISEIAPR